MAAQPGSRRVFRIYGAPVLNAEARALGWFGLQRNGAFVVTGVRQTPLLPALVFLLLVAGGVMLSWWREGK